jgi:hypothetical protein
VHQEQLVPSLVEQEEVAELQELSLPQLQVLVQQTGLQEMRVLEQPMGQRVQQALAQLQEVLEVLEI